KHILAIVPRQKPTGSRPGRIVALLPRSSSDPCRPAPSRSPFSMPPDALALASMNAMSTDVPAVKQAIDLVRRGRSREATEIQKLVREPTVKKLIEWAILRSEEGGAGFARYSRFLPENPDCPPIPLPPPAQAP